jgi:hypothetical protein
MTAIKNREYVLLFFVSLLVFYTVLNLLGPFIPLPGFQGTVVTGGVVPGNSGTCFGEVKLSFFPDVVDVGTRASAIISGLNNCYGKLVFVREELANNLVLKCSCVVATGNGCGCAFPVDYTVCSNRNFYAQVDLNGNGDYNDQGETVVVSMDINGCGII